MEGLPWIEIVYWAATIIGGTLFVLRTILLLIGGGLDHSDIDTHVGDLHTDFDGHLDVGHMDAGHMDVGHVDVGDFDAGHVDVGHVDTAHIGADHFDTHADTYASFKLLSMQGLTAFFMMFGLVGLALLRANLAVILTVAGAAAAGMFTVWVITMIFSQMGRLQSEGTLNVQNAIGETGSVYLAIPVQGSGQVRVTVQGALRILDAISPEDEKIETGAKVRVTGVVDSHTLIVERA
jgi:membrane protein implicated in regulation of membrane protease activity